MMTASWGKILWDEEEKLISYLLPDARKQITWPLLYEPQFKYVTQWDF